LKANILLSSCCFLGLVFVLPKRPEVVDNGELYMFAGESTNRVLNENWKQFWSELKPSFEETYAEVFLQLSKIIFGKVPENDIFLD
jgi:hypothetical protein